MLVASIKNKTKEEWGMSLARTAGMVFFLYCKFFSSSFIFCRLAFGLNRPPFWEALHSLENPCNPLEGFRGESCPQYIALGLATFALVVSCLQQERDNKLVECSRFSMAKRCYLSCSPNNGQSSRIWHATRVSSPSPQPCELTPTAFPPSLSFPSTFSSLRRR